MNINFRKWVQGLPENNPPSEYLAAKLLSGSFGGNPKIFVSNVSSEAYTPKWKGSSFAVTDLTGTPVATEIANGNYLPQLAEAIKWLCKDLNDGKIQIYDFTEFPCLTAATATYPTTFQALYSTGTDPVTTVCGITDGAFTCVLTVATGVTPKVGPYSYYGAEDVTYTLTVGDVTKTLTCSGAGATALTLVASSDTDDTAIQTAWGSAESATLSIAAPGFQTSTISIPIEQEDESEG